MAHYMDYAEAKSTVHTLVRGWRNFRRARRCRPSERRSNLIAALLSSIRDAAAEHYGLPVSMPSKTSMSRNSIKLACDEQYMLMLTFAIRLFESHGGFAPVVSQDEIRRAIVGSAVSAGQLLHTPDFSISWPETDEASAEYVRLTGNLIEA